MRKLSFFLVFLTVLALPAGAQVSLFGLKNSQIVAALIDLAHTFEMHALAEGVEDAEARAALLELGCDRGQGYHYSRPMPPTDFSSWYSEYTKSLDTEQQPEASQ